ECYRPAAELQIAQADEDAARETQDQAGVAVTVGRGPQLERDPHGRAHGPQEPVQQEVARAEEELPTLALGVGVVFAAEERIDRRRQERVAEHYNEHDQSDPALRRQQAPPPLYDSRRGSPRGRSGRPAGSDRRGRRPARSGEHTSVLTSL